MPILLIATLISLLLTGCNGPLKPALSNEDFPGFIRVSSGFPAPYLFQGSGVQWNERYAVSTAHTPLLANVAHECSTGCDLVFIEHKANSAVPNWRKPMSGEKVTTVGASPIHATVKGEGNTKPIKVSLERNGDRTAYSLTDAPVIKGMSGGPVYGRDNFVIGMIVGIFLPNSQHPSISKNNHHLSIYVPYEIILREWKIFEERQQLTTKKLELAGN